MKRHTCICSLLICLLALVMGASAETLSFAQLPVAMNPTLVPNGYANLDWSGFSYVDPIWSGAGPGFRQGPNALNVGFMGGKLCELTEISCSASISSNTIGAGATTLAGFQVKSAIVAAGYHSETINVLAYNHGQYVGSQTYNLGTSLQSISFPSNWGMITQLVIDTTAGTVVLYDLELESIGSSANLSVSEDLIGPTAPARVGATAPFGMVDPASSSVGQTAISVGASARKKVGSITNYEAQSGSALGNGDPGGPPINKVGATAPFGMVDPASSSVGQTAISVGPSARKKVGSVTNYEAQSGSALGNGDPGGPPINKVGATAPLDGRSRVKFHRSDCNQRGAKRSQEGGLDHELRRAVGFRSG